MFGIPLALLQGWHPLEQGRQLRATLSYTNTNFVTDRLHPSGSRPQTELCVLDGSSILY